MFAGLCGHFSCDFLVEFQQLTDFVIMMSGRVKRTPLFGADGLLGIQRLDNNKNKNNNDIMQVRAYYTKQDLGLQCQTSIRLKFVVK